jgi:hypothetical protein
LWGSTDPRNIKAIRFAEVLLSFAEAENEINQGPTSDAIDAVNRIRLRAGLQELQPGITADYESFKNAVREERKWELAFEGIRWHDLKRWGILKETIEASRIPWGGCVVEERHKYLPIPQAQIDLNPNLLPNNGY